MELEDPELTPNNPNSKNTRLIELLSYHWPDENIDKVEFRLESEGDSEGRWYATLIAES